MLTCALTLFAIVSFTTAQVPISSTCQATLADIATSPDANACLVLTPLSTIFTNPNASIVDPVNNWLTGLCAAPACSNTTLASIVANATAGCSAEIEFYGLSSYDNTALTTLVQQYYPTARKAVCLKDGNTNCVTEILTHAQDEISIPLSLTFDSSILPAQFFCMDCIKAIYNTINTDVPGYFYPQSFQHTCGTSFTDGTNITQSASNATQSTPTKGGNGATRLSFGPLSSASITTALALLVLMSY